MSLLERQRIAALRGQGVGVREIGRRLGRDPSTVSRELVRNTAKHDKGGYDGPLARARGARPGRSRLARDQVDLKVPRDRDGTFEPVIVKKRQRRLGEVDEIVLSLYARVLSTGEISAHFAQIYGASVSKETVSRITEKVIEEMTTWQSRPLNEVYAAIFIVPASGRCPQRSWSRSVTVRSPTGPSTRRSGSPPGRGEGRARVVGRHR